jgi:hypothetical protein
VPRAELACGRVRDDGDVMAVQLVRPALRLLAGRAACMAASCCTCMMWRFVPLHALMAMLEPCVWAHTPVGTGLVVRGEDLSCGAETCRARWRLVVRGEDFSCEAETCRGGSSSGKLVGDAVNWPKTRCLASVGLDQGSFSSLS